ncbi:mannosyltransferase [Knufia fluminis]|uniref:Mannosyltransferase n=1 Tax=Knufia fluminis TaxID=191047 RepID=A0AAN8E8P3_9EURO|nr:mannosyltransferase [Knufia fluminis]
MNVYRRGSRIWFLSVCVFVVIILLFYLKQQSPPPTLEPLPGTYQYFRERDFYSKTHKLGAVSHCDTRFALDHALGNDEIRSTLKGLLASYATTMRELDTETWLAHGTLLGWYWNRKLMPWDTDIDVQMPAKDIAKLAVEYNMTEFVYPLPKTKSSRRYLLDINPHYSIVSFRDVANKIDGRWIDQTNGKFIDITAIHLDEVDLVSGPLTAMFCKDGHRYEKQDIYPLEQSDFEGVEVKVPAKSDKILREEYGARSLTNTRFHWYELFRPF